VILYKSTVGFVRAIVDACLLLFSPCWGIGVGKKSDEAQLELSEEDILGHGSHTVLFPIQKLQLVLSLCGTNGVLRYEWIRNRQDAARRDSGERIRQLALIIVNAGLL
jgi:hypothetical protein